MNHGVMVDGVFEEREVYLKTGKGFKTPIWLRKDTYDEYVLKEISRSYGMLRVEGQIVLDIGANIGAFSVWADDHGAKLVWSVEPEENNFRMLQQNAVGHLIVPVNAALTDYNDDGITFYLAPSGKNPGNSSMIARRGRNEVTVPSISVEKLWERMKAAQPTVAKIDCEGAEFQLIPLLKNSSLKQMALEFHINGFGLELVENAHNELLEAGWICTKQPVIDSTKNLWQTLAAYRHE